MADELKPCQPDCPYCAAMDKGHLVDALRAEVAELRDTIDTLHKCDAVGKETTAENVALRAEVERQRKENESLAEADLTYAMETKELRDEVERLKAEGLKYMYGCADTGEVAMNAVAECDRLRAENAGLRTDNEELRGELAAIGKDAPKALAALGSGLTEMLDDDQWNEVEPMLAAIQLGHAAEVAALKAECAEAWRVHSEVVAALKAMYAEPLTDNQVASLADDWAMGSTELMVLDAAIRAAREGAK